MCDKCQLQYVLLRVDTRDGDQGRSWPSAFCMMSYVKGR